MYLPDINVWLALAFASHKHHRAASDWFETVQDDQCAFCRFTQVGFLRLAPTPKILNQAPLTLMKAWRSYDDLYDDPRVVYSDEPEDVEMFWREYTRRRTVSPKVWNDAYLAAFGRAADFELVSFDQALKQYRHVRCTIIS
jgi:toxin-antitoxin system PIN domain toxin